MKKQLILCLLLLLSVGAMGQTQNKGLWRQSGTMQYGDTVTRTLEHVYVKKFTYEPNRQACKCSVYSVKKEDKVVYMPCDSLVREFVYTVTWDWSKDRIYVKGKFIKETKAEFRQGMGVANLQEATYFYNNKRVYPLEIFNQPINH